MKELTPQRWDLLWRILSRLTGLSRERLTPDTPLLTEGYLTSLQVVELVNALEGETGIAFQDEDITPENFDTPRAMAELLRKRSHGDEP